MSKKDKTIKIHSYKPKFLGDQYSMNKTVMMMHHDLNR